jgi:hypothetical protein
MEHSVHIAAKHFVEAVAPASPATICQKVKTAKQNGTLDLGNFDVALADLGFREGEDGGGGLEEEDPEDDDNEDDDFTSGDALGKALALVKQV